MEKIRTSLNSSINNKLYEGVKDDAIAMAKKWRKDNSPEFKKLMAMLDKDRGLMVPFTKWLLGIPPKSKDKPEPGVAPIVGRRLRSGRGLAPILRDLRDLEDTIDMPSFAHAFERMRPAPFEELEHLYTQAKELGLQNIKKDLNSFKNSEEFGDYLTKEIGDKQVKDALGMTTFNENTKKFAGIVTQVKDMILKTPKIYNIFRSNVEHALVLAEFVARKGARYKTPDELFNAISAKLSELDDFSRESVIDKIKRFNLKAKPITEVNWGLREQSVLLVYIEDVTAMANLGSQEWCIAQAEGFGGKSWGGGGEATAMKKENINKMKKPTSSATNHFNNSYQLNKYKKAYILFDFSRDSSDLLRKICFIVDPGGEINGGWDAADTAITSHSHYGVSAEQLVLREYPELNE